MAISALFKKLSEVATYLIQEGEELISGDTGSDGTDGSGANRTFGQLFKNDEALLTAAQGMNSLITTGGGTLTWDGSQLTWSSTLTFNFVATIGAVNSNVVAASNATLTDGGYLVAYLNRETDGGSATIVTPTNDAQLLSVFTGAGQLDAVVLGYRSGSTLYFLNRMKFETGETGSLYDVPAYADNAYEGYVHENANRVVYTGGSMTWDGASLTWASSLFAQSPLTTGTHTIAASSIALGSGEAAYIAWTYDNSGALTPTVVKAALGSVPDAATTMLIAIRPTGLGVVYLWDGTLVASGRFVLPGVGGSALYQLNPDLGDNLNGGASITVAGGTGISTSGVAGGSGGGTLTVTNDVVALSDLTSVTADLEASILAAVNQSADAGNPLLTSDFVNNIQGFDCMWADGGTTLKVSPGILQDSGEWYPSSASINVTAANLDTGSIASPTWYYVYMTPGAAPGGVPIQKLSITAPTGFSRHPSNASWRYVGPVYFYSATQMSAMTKTGGTIKMHDFDITAELASLLAGVATAVDLSTVLPTTIGSGLVISIKGSSTKDVGSDDLLFVEDPVGVSRSYSSVVIDDPGGTPYDVFYNSIFFPTGINTPYLVKGQLGNATHSSLDEAWLDEFYEPQFGLRV